MLLHTHTHIHKTPELVYRHTVLRVEREREILEGKKRKNYREFRVCNYGGEEFDGRRKTKKNERENGGGALLNLHDNLVDIYCAGRELQMRIEKKTPSIGSTCFCISSSV